MNLIEKIKEKILLSINIKEMDVIDQSHLHKGHNFSSISAISHIKVIVVSDDFSDMSHLNRYRMLHNILKDEILLLHAISFSLQTIREAQTKDNCYIGKN